MRPSMLAPQTPRSSQFNLSWEDDIPIIDTTDSFTEVVLKLSNYISKAVDAAYTYEQLRTSTAGSNLRPLVLRLSEDCHHPALVAALLAARYIFVSNDDDDTSLSESRALACELVAWQFLTFLSEKESIDYLLYELPEKNESRQHDRTDSTLDTSQPQSATSESSPLLESRIDHGSNGPGLRPPKRPTSTESSESLDAVIGNDPDVNDELAQSMAGMNALEIAAVGNSKKFISQKHVQKIVQDIWTGNVIFWDSLSVNSKKQPRIYNKRIADPFSRLRVPKYQKAFQVGFFITFLVLYYAVLVERNPRHVTPLEVLLYLWIAAFAYDEFGEIQDAGLLFYKTDFWSLWDIAIIGVGIAFFVTRVVGLIKGSDYITDLAFDVLSMVALFLVPRICSVASMNPYFGSLLPVLKEMTAAFCKFLPVIAVLYLGFLTTFTMLARDRLTVREMSWILVKVFFGSSYLGFDVAVTISPVFGYTLMLIFVALTNILLITALVSLVSNSLTEVMAHAREEYLFQYSIYVLESSTSRRLTYFMPPLNLIPLLLLRPLRLVFPSEDLRQIRILALKATHVPFVALIWAYEGSQRMLSRDTRTSPATINRAAHLTNRPLSSPQTSLERSRELPRPRSPSAVNKPSPVAASGSADASAGVSALSGGDPDLVGLIQRLSSQVDELTAMIAGQQKD